MSARAELCLRGHAVALIGRDSSGRCLACKRLAMRAAYAQRAEQERAEEAEIWRAEFERRRAEVERRKEAEYQAAIAAGGSVAIAARWDRAWSVAAQAGTGLCQWSQDSGEWGGCFRRTDAVYCHVHMRQR